VVATWAGLRPLIKPEGSMATSAVSREHQIVTSPRGLLTIAGGKLTTARVMGAQVIDEAIKLLSANFGLRGVPASRSAQVPISGGDPGALFLARRPVEELPIDPAVKDRWLDRYGANAYRLAERARADGGTGQDLGVKHLTLAEVDYAVEEEMARTLTDFFTRRAAVFYWTEDGGLSLAGVVADRMGGLLGWSPDEAGRQVGAYRDWVTANRVAPAPA
jgi:glycerol-3-phosphate dehydrogenase